MKNLDIIKEVIRGIRGPEGQRDRGPEGQGDWRISRHRDLGRELGSLRERGAAGH